MVLEGLTARRLGDDQEKAIKEVAPDLGLTENDLRRLVHIMAWMREADNAPEVADPLTTRIAMVQGHLTEITELLPALEAELGLRRIAFEQLRRDAAQLERLAAVDKEKAEAVQKLVDETVRRGVNEAVKTIGQGLDETAKVLTNELDQTSKTGGRQQVLYFLYGLASSVPLGVAGNFLFEWLTN